MGTTDKDLMVEAAEAKPYEFRRLSATDVFPMFKIISKIGINEFTACFDSSTMKDLVAKFAENQESNDNEDTILNVAGITVALEIANVILGNLPKCENDIYNMLSSTSNLAVEEVKSLDMVIFIEMIVDFIKKEEFRDFLKVVSKLFK